MASKIPKVVAGYLPLRYVGMDGSLGTSCSKCYLFIRLKSECAILTDPKVSGPKGTCTQFIAGGEIARQPMYLVPKAVVGYIEGKDVPTYCGRCKHYENPQSRTSTCEGVGDSQNDTVEYGGCCNAYEAR